MRHGAWTALAAALVTLACSVGQGTGSARGAVSFPECRLSTTSFDLRPDFFVADFVEDPATAAGFRRRTLNLRMQRGSYGEWSSDGVSVAVRDVDVVAGQLGAPLAIGPVQPVQMTFYLGQSCPSGLPSAEFFTVPAILEAVRGSIVFHAIYAPDVDPNALHIAADFTGVRFEDAEAPGERFAQIDGDLSFFYQRGRPAQHFP